MRIDVKLGFNCNQRCRFCVQGEKRFEYPDKTTDEVKAILTQARPEASELVLTGGEVTIRPDLPEIVKHARSEGFSTIQLQTNGRMLSSQKITDALIDAGVTEFGPALHGPNPEIHDYLTRAPGSFKQIVRGIRNVKGRGYPVLTNSVITRLNYRYLTTMAELFVALGVDQFQFAFVHPLGTAAQGFEKIVPRFKDLQPHLLAALDVGIRAGVRCMTEAVPLCFLPGHESLAAEWIIPKTQVFDAACVIDDYTQVRRTEGKLKGDVCAACRYDADCEGPWREYPERYGWEEFAAVPEETGENPPTEPG